LYLNLLRFLYFPPHHHPVALEIKKPELLFLYLCRILFEFDILFCILAILLSNIVIFF
jgi:hypothetical protein